MYFKETSKMKDKLNIYVYTFKETLTTKNNQYKSYSNKAIGFKGVFWDNDANMSLYYTLYITDIYVIILLYSGKKLDLPLTFL